jgi:hypothetical protein
LADGDVGISHFVAASRNCLPMTPSVVELRRQLDRMLQSSVFASRPRSAEMLRFFVEQSIRNGFTPISQQQIATYGLGFDDGFSPARSAEVRVKVARLRDAVARYYRTTGQNDPLVLAVSQGPYELVVTSNDAAHPTPVQGDARHARRARPMLLVVEPQVSGESEHVGLGLDVALRLVTLLVEESLVASHTGAVQAVERPLDGHELAALVLSRMQHEDQRGGAFPLKPIWLIGCMVAFLLANAVTVFQEKKERKSEASSTIRDFASSYDQTISTPY